MKALIIGFGSYVLAGFLLGYIGKGKTRGPAKGFKDYFVFIAAWCGLMSFMSFLFRLF